MRQAASMAAALRAWPPLLSSNSTQASMLGGGLRGPARATASDPPWLRETRGASTLVSAPPRPRPASLAPCRVGATPARRLEHTSSSGQWTGVRTARSAVTSADQQSPQRHGRQSPRSAGVSERMCHRIGTHVNARATSRSHTARAKACCQNKRTSNSLAAKKHTHTRASNASMPRPHSAPSGRGLLLLASHASAYALAPSSCASRDGPAASGA